MRKVLLVDDEDVMLEALEKAIRRNGYEVMGSDTFEAVSPGTGQAQV